MKWVGSKNKGRAEEWEIEAVRDLYESGKFDKASIDEISKMIRKAIRKAMRQNGLAA